MLIVRAASHSEKWTVAGFNDAGEFRTVEIDGSNHDLSNELKNEPRDERKIIELATSELGRTLLDNSLFAAAKGSIERDYLDACIRAQAERDAKERKYISDLKEALQNAERAAQIAEARRLAAGSVASLGQGLTHRAGLLAVEAILATKKDGSVAPAELVLQPQL